MKKSLAILPIILLLLLPVISAQTVNSVDRLVDDILQGATEVEASAQEIGNQFPTAIIFPPRNVGKSPLTVNFEGQFSKDDDGRIVKYEWKIDGINMGEGEKYTHTFVDVKTYDVELTVTDNKGAIDTFEVQAFVLADDEYEYREKFRYDEDFKDGTLNPVITPRLSALKVNENYEFTLQNLERYGPEIILVEWDFGNGQTQKFESIFPVDIAYTETGEYVLSVTVENGEGIKYTDALLFTVYSQEEYENIKKGNPPKAVINAPRFLLNGKQGVFKAENSLDADGEIVSYLWNFGDGVTSSEINTVHTFFKTGEQTVTLTVTDNDGIKSESQVTVQVDELPYYVPPPITQVDGEDKQLYSVMGSVRVSNDKVKAGETIYFDASNSFSLNSEKLKFDWDFADGATAQGIKVEHTYTEVGDGAYIVVLKVTDEFGIEGHSYKTIQVRASSDVSQPPIIVEPPIEVGPKIPPIAIISKVVPPTGHAPLTVTFDGRQSYDEDGYLSKFHWDFADGTVIDQHTDFTREGQTTQTEEQITELEEAGTQVIETSETLKEKAIALLKLAIANPGVPSEIDGIVWPDNEVGIFTDGNSSEKFGKLVGLDKDQFFWWHSYYYINERNSEFFGFDDATFDDATRYSGGNLTGKLFAICDLPENLYFKKVLDEKRFESDKWLYPIFEELYNNPESGPLECILTFEPDSQEFHDYWNKEYGESSQTTTQTEQELEKFPTATLEDIYADPQSHLDKEFCVTGVAQFNKEDLSGDNAQGFNLWNKFDGDFTAENTLLEFSSPLIRVTNPIDSFVKEEDSDLYCFNGTDPIACVKSIEICGTIENNTEGAGYQITHTFEAELSSYEEPLILNLQTQNTGGIEVEVNDERDDAPIIFTYGSNPSFPIPELTDTIWHDAGVLPVNIYNINIPIGMQVGQSGKIITLKPASNNKYWFIKATSLGVISFDDLKVKIEIYTGSSSSITSATRCYEKTLDLRGSSDLIAGEQFETIDASSECGLVTRINYQTIPNSALKFKDTGFVASSSILGRVPISGEIIKFSSGTTVTINQNALLEASVLHNNTTGNLQQTDNATLSYLKFSPNQYENFTPVDALVTNNQEFRIDLAKNKGPTALVLTLKDSGKAWRIEAEKVRQENLGLIKVVNLRVYKNSKGTGTPCWSANEQSLDAFDNTYYADTCGLIFKVHSEGASDILFFSSVGPTFLELQDQSITPKISENPPTEYTEPTTTDTTEPADDTPAQTTNTIDLLYLNPSAYLGKEACYFGTVQYNPNNVGNLEKGFIIYTHDNSANGFTLSNNSIFVDGYVENHFTQMSTQNRVCGADSYCYTQINVCGIASTRTGTPIYSIEPKPQTSQTPVTTTPDDSTNSSSTNTDSTDSTTNDSKTTTSTIPIVKEGSINAGLITHTFEKPGVYNVTLTVTDNDKLSDTANFVVTVTEPVALFTPLPEFLNTCTATGPEAVTSYGLDRLLFKWGFNDIETNTCDIYGISSIDGTGYYCDSTQFSIGLVKRIAELENYVEKRMEENVDLEDILEETSTVESLQGALVNSLLLPTRSESQLAYYADSFGIPLSFEETTNDFESCEVDYSVVNNSLAEGFAKSEQIYNLMDLTLKKCSAELDSLDVLVYVNSSIETSNSKIHSYNNSDFKKKYMGVTTFDAFTTMYDDLESKYTTKGVQDNIEYRIGYRVGKNYNKNKKLEFKDLKEKYDFIYSKHHSEETTFTDRLRLTEFYVFMLSDAFSLDFKDDFKEHFTSSIDGVIAKNSLGSKFSIIEGYGENKENSFTDWVFPEERFKPGIYKVAINAKPVIESGNLHFEDIEVIFEGGVTIDEFEDLFNRLAKENKLTDESKLTQNPFFYLPFDGTIGLDKGRHGYGYGASSESRKPEDPQFYLQRNGNDGYQIARPDGGLVDLMAEKETGLTEKIQQGFVLVAGIDPNKNNFSMKHYQSVPVSLNMQSQNNNFNMFYGFLKGSELLTKQDYANLGKNEDGKDYLFTWFDSKGNALNEEIRSDLKEYCEGWNETRTLSQLFYPQDNEVQGVAFVAKDTRLGFPCVEEQAQFSATLLDSSKTPTLNLTPGIWFGGTGQAVDIGKYTTQNSEKFQETLEDYIKEVNNGRICIASSQDIETVNNDYSILTFRWNPEAFAKPLPEFIEEEPKELLLEIVAEREPPYIAQETVSFWLKENLDGVYFDWRFTDNPNISNVKGETTAHRFDSVGEYTVMVFAIEDKENGKIVKTASKLVTVINKPKFDVKIVTDKQQPFIVDDLVKFTALSELGENGLYEWKFSDTVSLIGKTGNPMPHKFTRSGDFKVKVIARPKGSYIFTNDVGFAELNVKVVKKTQKPIEQETVFITHIPSQPFYVFEPVEFTAHNKHGDEAFYKWHFSDELGVIGNYEGKVKSHKFNREGTFRVSVEVQLPTGPNVGDLSLFYNKVAQASITVKVIKREKEHEEKIAHILTSKVADVLEAKKEEELPKIDDEIPPTNTTTPPGTTTKPPVTPPKTPKDVEDLDKKRQKKIAHILTSAVANELEKPKSQTPDEPIDPTKKVPVQPTGPDIKVPDNKGPRDKEPDGKDSDKKPPVDDTKEEKIGRQLPGNILDGLKEVDKEKPTDESLVFNLEAVANPTTGTVPLTVEFSATSTHANPLYEWHFGDEKYAFGKLGQSVTHRYTRAGTYTAFVLLKTNLFDKALARRDIIIVVNPKEKTIADAKAEEKKPADKTSEKPGEEAKTPEEKSKEEQEKAEKLVRTGRELPDQLSDQLEISDATPDKEKELPVDKDGKPAIEITVTTIPSPPEGEVPLKVTFQASSNLDPDVQYEWHYSQDLLSFGQVGSMVMKTYRQAGEYQVRVIAKTKGFFQAKLGEKVINVRVFSKEEEGKTIEKEPEKKPTKEERAALCEIKILADNQPPFYLNSTINLRAESQRGSDIDYLWYFNNETFGTWGEAVKHIFRREGVIEVEVYGKEKGLFSAFGDNVCYGKTMFEILDKEKEEEETKKPVDTNDEEIDARTGKVKSGYMLTDALLDAMVEKQEEIEEEIDEKLPDDSKPGTEPGTDGVERELVEILIDAQPSATGDAPFTVVFNATNSQNLDLACTFKFDDNTSPFGVTKNPVKHTYSHPGTYLVKVNCKTKDFLFAKKIGEAFTVVTVTGDAPIDTENEFEEPIDKEDKPIFSDRLKTGFILPGTLIDLLVTDGDILEEEQKQKTQEEKQKEKEETESQEKEIIDKIKEQGGCEPCTNLYSCKACVDIDLYSDLFTSRG